MAQGANPPTPPTPPAGPTPLSGATAPTSGVLFSPTTPTLGNKVRTSSSTETAWTGGKSNPARTGLDPSASNTMEHPGQLRPTGYEAMKSATYRRTSDLVSITKKTKMTRFKKELWQTADLRCDKLRYVHERGS
ncbi:unnamed protein product [Cylindrotheca closterium]|uniref:Uncharacterized protein n=1 Tax=Cylindrotheca closterium TaxID=2856 RepID=A0AAD2FTW6_9STRA|nr:unnamed protein product [Cylindrotheca closterium]